MKARLQGARRRTASLLASVLAGALVLSGCSIYDAPLPGGADTGDDPKKITLMFRDVLDLVPQSTVKVDDVTVGKVSAIKLKGYVAQVTVEIPGDLKMPDNTTAQIRQTSLLGEKFIALERPDNPGSGELGNNDVIGLDRTGRNPEVEEVFGALALLLNGGGVGQLKTIFSELNNAFTGREDEVRSVLTQIRLFMGQLDRNKGTIVAALENTNRLALQLREQDGTIKSALDNIPNALRSVNRQRADLVRLLQALSRLSGVGVRVIRASKESTINSLRDLAPVLEGLAKAGQNFPKSTQVFLTYPFVDAAIGNDPQVARNLHMGDFTNLSVNLDVDVTDLTVPGLPPPPGEVCDALGELRRRRPASSPTSSSPPQTFPTPPFTDGAARGHPGGDRQASGRPVRRPVPEPERGQARAGRQRDARGRGGGPRFRRSARAGPRWPRRRAREHPRRSDGGHRSHASCAAGRRLPVARAAGPVRSGCLRARPRYRHDPAPGGG